MTTVAGGERARTMTMPHAWWRTTLVTAGFATALCVYYLNYGAGFEEGVLEDKSPLALPLRIMAVAAIVLATLPLRIRAPGPIVVLMLLYVLSAAVLVCSAGAQGGFNDILFFNTVLQLPLLAAFTSSTWRPDEVTCWTLISVIVATQAIADAAIWYTQASLWLSSAFVGGVGNPSSFGLLCTLSLAFCLFHPAAGRRTMLLAPILVVAAVMSKSLFAVLAVGGLIIWWVLGNWRRTIVGGVVLVALLVGFLTLATDIDYEGELGFVTHKVRALLALIGLIEYDIESAGSVSTRIEMLAMTIGALDDSPWAVLLGGLRGLAYWPIDSQVLTYLGSFGVVMLLTFAGLHCYWMVLAWRTRRKDGGFSLICLALFGLIFVSNRILDYFPVAAVYFLVIANAYWASSLAPGRSLKHLKPCIGTTVQSM